MSNFQKYFLKNRIAFLYAVGFLFLGCSVLLGVLLGSTRLSFTEIIEAFLGGFDSSAGARIFVYVRVPRMAAAIICGAALSVAGVVIQAVFANKLASPSVIGVNAGAGLAVTVCTALGMYGGWQTPLCAFTGAFLAVMVISVASQKWGASRGTVILLGVAMNSLLGAISDTITTFLPDVGVMSNDFRIGEFSSITYQKLLPAVVFIVLTLCVLFTLTNELDVITIGDDEARGLGMNTGLMRVLFLLLAALLAGCAVSIAGLLSFVGLIVPHAVRRVAGNKSSHLIGLSALFGGAFVCICDTIARTVFAPYEVPVGIIMAFLGAPFFVFILIKGKGGHSRD